MSCDLHSTKSSESVGMGEVCSDLAHLAVGSSLEQAKGFVQETDGSVASSGVI